MKSHLGLIFYSWYYEPFQSYGEGFNQHGPPLDSRVGEKTQLLCGPNTKTQGLSSVPVVSIVDGENQLLPVVLCPPCLLCRGHDTPRNKKTMSPSQGNV